jgi:lysozyme
MKPSGNALRLIKQFEGLRLNAYLDQVGIPTIGYGNTTYTDGAKVNMGDKITRDKADAMLFFTLENFGKKVDELVKTNVSQNQFDALCSFAYNVGVGALGKSTLLKKVNQNPDDPTIELEFLKWNKGRISGQLVPLNGLTKRRQAEADFYFMD